MTACPIVTGETALLVDVRSPGEILYDHPWACSLQLDILFPSEETGQRRHYRESMGF